MTANTGGQIVDDTYAHMRLGLLIGCHIVTCCVSLAYLSYHYFNFYFFYDPKLLAGALVVVAAFATLTYGFLRAPFTFGYLLGFYFYTMVLGYLWLNCFSEFKYDHRLSGLSAAASIIAFLIPALFVSSPIRQRFTLTETALDRVLTLILMSAAATILIGATYSFKLVSLEYMYDFRDKIDMPNPLNYWIGIISNALLPFAFACFAIRGNYWRAGLVLVLLLLFYPITLNKVAFFTPAWLVAMALLTRLFDCKTTVVLSLFLPLVVGVVLYAIFADATRLYFQLINLRMIATPSNAMDIYNDFFFNHANTYFCQIRLLRAVVACPYQAQLGIVMQDAYHLGNFNASLFSTEGIASVGPLLAPIPVLVCGLVIGLGNRLSAGLPPRFVLISGSILPHILLNVPLTTSLLSHGTALLFLLWYLTPRSLFPQETPVFSSASDVWAWLRQRNRPKVNA